MRYHTMSVFRFALAETDSQAAKRVRTEIAGGQPRCPLDATSALRDAPPLHSGARHEHDLQPPERHAPAVFLDQCPGERTALSSFLRLCPSGASASSGEPLWPRLSPPPLGGASGIQLQCGISHLPPPPPQLDTGVSLLPQLPVRHIAHHKPRRQWAACCHTGMYQVPGWYM
jgi:hypothetical protein